MATSRPAPSTLGFLRLRKFFDLAVSDGVIPRNPMDGITYRKRSDLTRLTTTRSNSIPSWQTCDRSRQTDMARKRQQTS